MTREPAVCPGVAAGVDQGRPHHHPSPRAARPGAGELGLAESGSRDPSAHLRLVHMISIAARCCISLGINKLVLSFAFLWESK